jgi:phosphoserine aminotransferase
VNRIHNFSAGPAVLPEPVLEQARADLWSHGGTGIGIVECSHRSAQFDEVHQSAKARIKRLMGLGDDHEVLFLQGGARQQFWMWPANILKGGRAVYLDTGKWAEGAAADAKRYGEVSVPWSSKSTGWDHVPEPGAWGELPDDTVYLHYTSNNTVAGSEFSYVPDPGDALLVCDMSSNILSAPIEGERFDFIYAGAQKNLGPSGVTVCIVRRSLLDRMSTDLPDLVRYPVQVKKDSMLNTPCTFGIYMIDQVTGWIESQGGLKAVGERNRAQADKVYGAIEASSLFRPKVRAGSRSRMNVTFTTGDDALDTRFWKSAAEQGLSGLKGHRSVGGLRASLYNAQTDEAVDALVQFMRQFESTQG